MLSDIGLFLLLGQTFDDIDCYHGNREGGPLVASDQATSINQKETVAALAIARGIEDQSADGSCSCSISRLTRFVDLVITTKFEATVDIEVWAIAPDDGSWQN